MLAERDQLLSEVYDELRAAASRMLHRDAPMLTLQPTELVNEAALRIIRLEQMSWNDRQHFFATGARIMRQAMMDAIKSRKRAKRQAPSIFFKTTPGIAGSMSRCWTRHSQSWKRSHPNLQESLRCGFSLVLNLTKSLLCWKVQNRQSNGAGRRRGYGWPTNWLIINCRAGSLLSQLRERPWRHRARRGFQRPGSQSIAEQPPGPHCTLHDGFLHGLALRHG